MHTTLVCLTWIRLIFWTWFCPTTMAWFAYCYGCCQWSLLQKKTECAQLVAFQVWQFIVYCVYFMIKSKGCKTSTPACAVVFNEGLQHERFNLVCCYTNAAWWLLKLVKSTSLQPPKNTLDLNIHSSTENRKSSCWSLFLYSINSKWQLQWRELSKWQWMSWMP